MNKSVDISHSLTVKTKSASYPIYIGAGLLSDLSALCECAGLGKRCVLVCDSNTRTICETKCVPELEKGGFHAPLFTFPAGEKSKNIRTLETLYDFLAKAQLDRSSFLIAVGGGVVGDMTGFAAATWMRGIPFVQVPTSLLAQVDSSVGGKTGFDLAAGKNLVGAFHHPRLVVCDVDCLQTLPMRELSCGMAEVIKTALILDTDFFEWLRQNVDRAMQYNPDALAMIVQKCCAWKASVVAQDEREGGVRAILNFGHTLGHALEKVTGYARWTHGEAIAIGQVFACLLSEAVFQFPSEATRRLIELFGKAQLPTAAEDLPADQFIPQIMAALQMDKKTVCSIPRFVLLKRVGEAVFGNETDEEKVKDILRQVLGEENK